MKSSIDPTIGATNTRVLEYYSDRYELKLMWIDLTLPKRLTVEVLLITVEELRISLPTERVRVSRYVESSQYIDASDDGHIRGFYRGKRKEKQSLGIRLKASTS